MRTELEQALQQVQQGAVAQTAEVVERIKALPRDEEGVFDLKGAEKEYRDVLETRRVLYPVYAAYETDCNRKEGYPDILAQMRVLDARLQGDYDMLAAAMYMDMALRTLLYISQEIYESYRELMDLYKKNVRRFIQEFYGERKILPGAVPSGTAEVLFIGSLMLACRVHVLQTEKYESYFAFMKKRETGGEEPEQGR